MDYLYIPLGGNRKGKARTYLNLFLTMLLGGLWHGAGWNFIIWGVLHGLALVIHKFWMEKTGSRNKLHGFVSNVICTLLTFIFVSFTWVFFVNSSFLKAIEIISGIFSFKTGLQQPYFWSFIAIGFVSVATVIACVHSRNNDQKKLNMCRFDGFYCIKDLKRFWNLVLFFVFCGVTIGLFFTESSPFIYGAF